MKKIIVISFMAAGILIGCNKEEMNENNKSQIANEAEVFSPAEFLKEAEEHDLEWYIASVSKLSPEQAEDLEKYREEYDKEQEQKKILAFNSIFENAKINEFVNEEGQKNIEYLMTNTLGYDVEWFQFSWLEGDTENVSQAAENIKFNQEFKLIIDPAFDKTLDDIDLTTLRLNSSN